MDALKFLPMDDQIFVEIDDSEFVNGIFRPYNAPNGPKWATVRALGAGRRSDTTGTLIQMPPLVPGDRVLVHSGAGTPITLDGIKLRTMFARDIIALALSPAAPTTTE